MIWTDGSALGNPGPTGSGVAIKKNGPESTEIKIAHAITKMGTSYQGELQAIRIGIIYAKENINIYWQPSSNSSHHRAKSQKLPWDNDHRNKTTS